MAAAPGVHFAAPQFFAVSVVTAVHRALEVRRRRVGSKQTIRGVAREKWQTFRNDVGMFGLGTAIRWRAWRRIARAVPSYKPVMKIRTRACRTPMLVRLNSSDERVVRHVFTLGSYAGLNGLEPPPRLVVDCGANAGYSALYFLQRWPEAHIVAIEPDPQNFELCASNLRPFASRVTLLRAGVWSRPVGLVVRRGSYRDGGHWAVQVAEAAPGERPDVEATSIGDVLARSGFDRIGFLKIDVEGAERVIFGDGAAADWLGRVDHLAIELHDADCEAAFASAMAGYDCDRSMAGDLTICKAVRSRP